MKTKLGIFFFLLGLTTSAVFGAIVGNKIMYIVVVALISGLCLALVSLVVYKILEMKVPEFIEFLENVSYSNAYLNEDYSSDEEEEESGASESIEDYAARQSTTHSHDETVSPKQADTKQKDKSSPGVITIDNITIKNEPKLMAEAIRTMLASDESSSSSAAPHK